jgi:hypothetical protein
LRGLPSFSETSREQCYLEKQRIRNCREEEKMTVQLEHVAKRAATWSQTANTLKARLDLVRWLVFGLGIAGALVAAVASQIQLAPALASNAHAVLTTLGTVLLAAGAFISNRLLRDFDVQAWVRARAASEALKREAFKYATRAEPYDSGDVEQKLNAERAKIEADLDDLADREVPPVGQAPEDTSQKREARRRAAGRTLRRQLVEIGRPWTHARLVARAPTPSR